MSTPIHRRTHVANHSELQGALGRQDGMQEEEDVRSVEQFISLYNANKINKSNVWNCELIDKLDTLVRHHNAYIRNFRNIGKSLDATMKVYEIRVDSVFNDVRRLGYGIASTTSKDDRADTDSDRMSNQADVANESLESVSEIKRKLYKKQKRSRMRPNIANIPSQLNAPLPLISLPDDLTSKLNFISSDTAASSRLFTSVLTTKQSSLRLSSGERFIETGVPVSVEIRDNLDYGIEDFIALPGTCDLNFGEHLPIRPSESGLAGYRIRDTPMDEDDSEDESMVFDEAPDIPPDYAFDVNADVDVDVDGPFWQGPTGSTVPQNNNNNDDDSPFGSGTIHQDFNNNDGMSFDDVEVGNENDNNNNINNRIKLLKGEYAYKAFSNIRNFWAGPTYWKFSKNLNQSQLVPAENVTRGGRKKKHHIKPTFDDDDDESDDGIFIKINSKAAKKLRRLNRALWSSERLKLPPQCNVPNDLFDKYNYYQQLDTSTESVESNQVDNYDDDDMDFGTQQMDYENNNDLNQVDLPTAEEPYQPDLEQSICQQVENPPLVVEKIPINFDKRPKVVNMQRMYSVTLWSLERQFSETASSRSPCNMDTTEELEPGKAQFSKVFKDLLANQKKFMDRRSELTMGLVLSSVLKAANEQRLRFNKRPNEENDFPIAKIRRIE